MNNRTHMAPPGPSTQPGRVVVGIDGTASGGRAFRWAVAEARLRQQRLVAVMAWSFLDQHKTDDNPDVDPHYGPSKAEVMLDRFVADATDGPLDITVEKRTVNDLSTRALTNAVEPNDLLVVGAGHRQGLPGLHLGSVSVFCATHAPCPVVVVRNTTVSAPANRNTRA